MSGEEESATIDKRKKLVKDEEAPVPPYLPEEIAENILTRLPARVLACFTCVSNSWYNLISNDARFAAAHFFHNKNKFNLVFNFSNIFEKLANAYYFTLRDDVGFLDSKLLMTLSLRSRFQLVGYCNGLACLQTGSRHGDLKGVVKVINPNRGETLTLVFSTPKEGSCTFLCHGFGFDSLSQAYKVIVIYASKDDDEFVCMVNTLGTISWRTIVTSFVDMASGPGCSAFPGIWKATSPWRYFSGREGTLCGGDIFWILHTSDENNVEVEIMLLSFDIHNEKIQFIRLPAVSTMNEHTRCSDVTHHVLKFEGYPCVARLEAVKISDVYLDNHQRSFCHCRFEVQLYILKDKLEQVWVKGGTFHAQTKEEGLLPDPFRCYYDSRYPRARILSFSNQVLLYWFDEESLMFYNMQTKHMKVVKCSCSCNPQNRVVFELEMKGLAPGHGPYMHYQLHAQVENIGSLKTFIPEGGTIRKFDGYDDFHKYFQAKFDTSYTDFQKHSENKNHLPAGWVSTGRLQATVKHYVFS